MKDETYKLVYKLGVVVVLGVSMWVSCNHTLALYRSGHFRGGLEWGGMIAAETAFLMGVLMSVDSRRRGHKPPWQSKMLFFIGLGVVGWANIAAGVGYEKSGKLTGVILGGLIPVFIFGAEAILSHSYMRSRKEKEEMEGASKVEKDSKMETERYSEVENMESLQSGGGESSKVEMEEVEECSKVEEVENPSKEEMEDMERTSKLEDTMEMENCQDGESSMVENMEDASKAKVENSSKMENPSKVEVEGISKVEKLEKKKTAKVEKLSKVENASKEEMEEVEKAEMSPIEWAIYLHQKDGELPGRKKLMEVAGCSEWIARKTLSELKKKIS